MEYTWIIAAFIILPLIGQIMSQQNRVNSGSRLQQKFVSLGNMAGKTDEEIFTVAGKPNGIAHMGEGRYIYQWSDTGYNIAILFEDRKVKSIINEFVFALLIKILSFHTPQSDIFM
jgi:hypothetical protein